MDVKSRNLFELLGDDDNDAPEDAAISTNKKASPPVVAQQKNAAAIDRSRATPGENSSKTRTEYPRRGGSNAGRGNRGDADGQQKDRPQRFSGPRGGDNSNSTVGDRPYRERKSETWDGPSTDSQDAGGRGRGRGAYRGHAGGRGREYDRKSGRMDINSEKKEFAGKGAWGDPVTSETGGEHVEGLTTDQALATVNADAKQNEPAEDVFASAEEGAATAAEKEPDPEEKYKSLQDYMKEQAEKKKIAPSATVSRKANEGADTSLWKDTIEFKRNEEDDVFIALGQTKSKKSSGVVAKEKVQVDLNITFNQGNARRGGKVDFKGKGRGGDKDNGKGWEAREGLQVQLNDTNAFPSLKKD